MSTHVVRKYVVETEKPKPRAPRTVEEYTLQRAQRIERRIRKSFTFTIFQLADPSFTPEMVTLRRISIHLAERGAFCARRSRSHPDVARYIARIEAVNVAMSPPPLPSRPKFNLNDIWSSTPPAPSSAVASTVGVVPASVPSFQSPSTASSSTGAISSTASLVADRQPPTVRTSKRKRVDSNSKERHETETTHVSEPRTFGAHLTNTVHTKNMTSASKKPGVTRDLGKASEDQALFDVPAPTLDPHPTPSVLEDKSVPLDIKSLPISLATSRVIVMADILDALSPFPSNNNERMSTYALANPPPKGYICDLAAWDNTDPKEPEDPVKALYDRVSNALKKRHELKREFVLFEQLGYFFNKKNIPHLPDAIAERLEEVSETFPNWVDVVDEKLEKASEALKASEEEDFEEKMKACLAKCLVEARLCIVRAIVRLSEGWEDEGRSVIGCMRL